MAMLEIEIGGLTAGSEYDTLEIAGTASLDGTLAVSLIGGFAPDLDNSFEVLRADGGIFGTFANSTLPVLSAGLDWNVVYSNFAVLLQVVATGIPGDYNQNGVVDAADYVVWRKSDGSQAGYHLWRANFGRTVGAASRAAPSQLGPPRLGGPTAAVPEAEAFWLTITGIGIGALFCRHLCARPSSACW
jgi:hypothetical protein